MIYQGDCLDIMPTLETESVQCVVTSPPYYGLRDYGVEGQIGLESTPEAYVEKMVAVFGEVRRVLRNDGTVWLNLGDSYNGSGKAGINPEYQAKHTEFGKPSKEKSRFGMPTNIKTLKPKDLIGIPWRVAFALQADGWWLRSDIIWHKPNPMPESVTDRPTKSHEYLFLLVKSQRYYYDAEAIKESCQSGPSDIKKMEESRDRIGGKHKDLIDPLSKASSATKIGRKRSVGNPAGRNCRSVWTISTQPFPGAHFATFPEALVKPCMKSGTSEKGCCPECGSPWERVTDISYLQHRKAGKWCDRGQEERGLNRSESQYKYGSATRIATTTGWRPTCNHNHEPAPSIVLDPFSGAGTVGVVAEKLGRKFIGIELNPEYVAIAERRIYNVHPLLLAVTA
ncbi:MAG: site-specific DNA-methyltransferase [bacterium]